MYLLVDFERTECSDKSTRRPDADRRAQNEDQKGTERVRNVRGNETTTIPETEADR